MNNDANDNDVIEPECVAEVRDRVIEMGANDEALDLDVKMVLRRKQETLEEIRSASRLDKTYEQLAYCERAFSARVNWVQMVAETLSEYWVVEAHRDSLVGELWDQRIADLGHCRALTSDPRDTEPLDRASSHVKTMSDSRREVDDRRIDLLTLQFAQILDALRAATYFATRYRSCKWWRALRFRGFDFAWDLALPIILFFCGIGSGSAFSFLLTIVGWGLSRFFVKPVLDRVLHRREKRLLIANVTSLFDAWAVVGCYRVFVANQLTDVLDTKLSDHGMHEETPNTSDSDGQPLLAAR